MSTQQIPSKRIGNFSIDYILQEDREILSNSQPFSSTFSRTIQIKPHRRRSTFSALQVHVLENEFYKHRYVSAEKRARLAAFLGLSQQQIKIWFQNRRYKTKIKNNERNFDPENRVQASESPPINVPLQSTNPIFPAWLLQRRASIFVEIARQARLNSISTQQTNLVAQNNENEVTQK